MKLKSLLIGSAAALVAVSGARAADAIIAEPEPVEYVRVCDAFGAGYFYIPGGETCLKFSGFVRYQIGFDSRKVATDPNSKSWQHTASTELVVSAKSSTDLGDLEGLLRFNASRSGFDTPAKANELTAGNFVLERAYIDLAGLNIGLNVDYFDRDGVPGENDQLGGTLVNQISYNFAANGVTAGLMLIDDGDATDYVPDVQARATFAAGPATIAVIAAYDNDNNDGAALGTGEFAVKGVVNADVAEGTKIGLAAIYASGANAYWDAAEWTVAGSVQQKLSDTLSLSVGAQYWNDTNLAVAGSPDQWSLGANLDWTPVKGFLVRANVRYTDPSGNALAANNASFTTGYLRFQRSF
jgi:hypothetical protein